jgi:hypothetical protein
VLKLSVLSSFAQPHSLPFLTAVPACSTARHGERLIVPAVLGALFSFMSRGFMSIVGGSTRRMKTVWLCSIGFIFGALYCIAWQDKIAWLFGWVEAWKALVVAFAIGSIYLCRRLLLKQ